MLEGNEESKIRLSFDGNQFVKTTYSSDFNLTSSNYTRLSMVEIPFDSMLNASFVKQKLKNMSFNYQIGIIIKNTSRPILYDDVKKLLNITRSIKEEYPLKIELILLFPDLKKHYEGTIDEDLTCLQLAALELNTSSFSSSSRCFTENNVALFGRPKYRGEIVGTALDLDSSSCNDYLNNEELMNDFSLAMDGDVGTKWSFTLKPSSTADLSYIYRNSLKGRIPTHYAIVAYSKNTAPTDWDFEVLISSSIQNSKGEDTMAFEEWVSLDSQKDVLFYDDKNDDIINNKASVIWFPLNISKINEYSTNIIAFRITFKSKSNQKKSRIIEIAEFGLFDIPYLSNNNISNQSRQEYYLDGNIGRGSWYASNEILSNPSLSLPILVVPPNISPKIIDIINTTTNLDQENGGKALFLSIAPFHYASVLSTKPKTKRFIESKNKPIINIGKLYNNYPSFIGVIDEFRLWSTPRSTKDISDLKDVELKDNNMNEESKKSLLIYWNFDQQLDPTENNTLNYDKNVCAVGLPSQNPFSGFLPYQQSQNISIPVTTAVFGTNLPWKKPDIEKSVSVLASRAPISGGPIIVYADHSGRAEIDLLGRLIKNENAYTYKIDNAPINGQLKQVIWRKPNGNNDQIFNNEGIIRIGRVIYQRNGNQSVDFDFFNYAIKTKNLQRVGIVIIYFKYPILKPNYPLEIKKLDLIHWRSLDLERLSQKTNNPMAIKFDSIPKEGLIYYFPINSIYVKSHSKLKKLIETCGKKIINGMTVNMNEYHIFYIPSSNFSLGASYATSFDIKYSEMMKSEDSKKVNFQISIESNENDEIINNPVINIIKTEKTKASISLVSRNDDGKNNESVTNLIPFISITPILGRLIQVDGKNIDLDNPAYDGIFLRNTYVEQYVKRVLRFSTQAATCFACALGNNINCLKDNSCSSPLSGAQNHWAKQIVDKPDGLSWSPMIQNSGTEFIEFALEAPVFINGMEIYKSLTGYISKISVSDEYLDSTDKSSCFFPQYGDLNGGMNCSILTKWKVIWEEHLDDAVTNDGTNLNIDIGTNGYDFDKNSNEMVWEPKTCFPEVATKYVRIELNSKFGRSATIDAIKIKGTRIKDSALNGRVVSNNKTAIYVIEPGTYGYDSFEYVYTNCRKKFMGSFQQPISIVSTKSQNESSNFYKVQPPMWFIPTATTINNNNNTLENNKNKTIIKTVDLDLKDIFSIVLNALTVRDIKMKYSKAKYEIKLYDSGLLLKERSFLELSSDIQNFEKGQPHGMIVPLTLPDGITDIHGNYSEKFSVTFHNIFDESFTFNLRGLAKINCPINVLYDNKYGMCSGKRHLLPGQCIQDYELNTRKCNCNYNSLISTDFVAGQACEYTMWESCNGRGYPMINDQGNFECSCFDKNNFGGLNCQIRHTPIKNFQEMINEAQMVKDRLDTVFPNHIFELNIDNISLAVTLHILSTNLDQSKNPTQSSSFEFNHHHHEKYRRRNLVKNTLKTFDFKYESNPFNSCNGHGKPTYDGKCNCDADETGIWEPPFCLTQTSCSPGYYIEYIFENITDGSKSNEINGTKCEICPIGFYCDSREKIECEADTFAHVPGKIKCDTRCEKDGHYLSKNSSAVNGISCKPCPPGSSCDGKNKQLCSPGYFSPDYELTACIECNKIGSTYFTENYGSEKCDACPLNSIRINSGGRSKNECVCKKDYWAGDINASYGVQCIPCPSNAICLGNTNNLDIPQRPPYKNLIPYPKENFWGDPKYPFRFFECEDDTCIGGPDYECSEGTVNILCSVCADGWFEIGSCQRCPGGGGSGIDFIFVLVAWIGIIFCWVLINKASTEVRALDIALLFTQIISLVQQFDLVFPPPLSYLAAPFEISDFEIDYLSPNCYIKRWGYYEHYAFQISLPFAYAFFEFILVAFAKWRVYRIKALEKRHQNNEKKCHRRSESIDSFLLELNGNKNEEINALKKKYSSITNKKVLGMRQRIIRGIGSSLNLPCNIKEYREFKSKQIGLVINFVLITYPSITILTFEPFRCFSLADGTNVMMGSPNIKCWEGAHIALVTTSTIVGLLIVVCTPVFLNRKLTILNQKDTKAQIQSFLRYGQLYEDFKQANYKWECWLLFRRFSIATTLVLLQGHPYIQATVGIVIIVLCLTLQMLYQPFISKRLNILDQTGMFTTFMFIFFGVVFTAYRDSESDLQDFTANAERAMAWILFLITISTLILAFVIFYLDSRDLIRVLQSEAKLVRRTQYQDVSLVRTVRNLTITRSIDDVEVILKEMKCKSPTKTEFGKNKKKLDKNKAISSVASASKSAKRKLSGMSKGLKKSLSSTSEDDQIKGNKGTNNGNLIKKTSDVASSILRNSTSFAKSKTIFLKNQSFHLKKKARAKSLFSAIDVDNSGEISIDEMKEYVQKKLELKGDASLQTMLHLFDEYDTDRSGLIDRSEFDAMIDENKAPDVRASTLKMSLKSKYLIDWVQSRYCSPLQTCLFFELDEAIHNILKSDSPLSQFRNTADAIFYRELTQAFPMILDWLAVLDDKTIIQFQRIVKQLQDCIDSIKYKGTYSKVIVESARAPFAYWLINQSTTKDRVVFKAFMTSILKSSGISHKVYELTRQYKTLPKRTNTSHMGKYLRSSNNGKFAKRISAALLIQRTWRSQISISRENSEYDSNEPGSEHGSSESGSKINIDELKEVDIKNDKCRKHSNNEVIDVNEFHNYSDNKNKINPIFRDDDDNKSCSTAEEAYNEILSEGSINVYDNEENSSCLKPENVKLQSKDNYDQTDS